MKKIYLLIPFVLLFFACQVMAQQGQRYTDEVFTDAQIKLTSNVLYGQNATIFPLLFDTTVNEFVPEPLFMDVYEPGPFYRY